jgi:isocitrate dehydrogenase (NAD+)
MKLGDGLFLNTCKRIAEEEYSHTGIKFDSMIVDNTSMQLVSRPQQFDVMVMVSDTWYSIKLVLTNRVAKRKMILV